MGDLDRALSEELAARRESGLLRRLPQPVTAYTDADAGEHQGARSRVSLGTNDYLGLSRHPEVIAAAQNAVAIYGTGATGSRLTSGNLAVHSDIEAALADFKGTEAALVFPTGYQAAIGTIGALVGPGDLLVSDALNHACLIDGCRLSGATIRVFAHNDAHHARRLLAGRRAFRRCLIVTEGLFSMDGDLAQLAGLAALREEFGCWLMVDDAHGTGVLGDGGVGACAAAGIRADVQMGTLSKALGSSGGFIAGSRTLVEHLVGAARSFLFTTGLPPASAAAASAALCVLRREPERVEAMRRIATKLRKEFVRAGLNVLPGHSPIIPILIGDPLRASAVAAQLDPKYQVAAIRPPTVPAGTSRLRVTATSLLEDADIEEIVEHFRLVVSRVQPA